MMIIKLTDEYRLNSTDCYNWELEKKTSEKDKTRDWRPFAFFADIEQALNYILKSPRFYTDKSEKKCREWLKEVERISEKITSSLRDGLST